MQILNFRQNYNNHLLQEFFSTIRLDKNLELMERIQVMIGDQHYCYADVVGARKMSLKEVIDENLNLLEFGLPKQEFVALLKKFYSKVKGWSGMKTEVNVFYLKKVIQLKITDNL